MARQRTNPREWKAIGQDGSGRRWLAAIGRYEMALVNLLKINKKLEPIYDFKLWIYNCQQWPVLQENFLNALSIVQ